ncbi:polysaccharide biosynthesis/export family protein [Qipengyuania vesicularis]|uniref:polysaccharide biosynthesis/export family protein n=1 Tax=Qipengyuania vesicularis TaxID=2867232 RepID=UPI001C886845|nr:polysaccharide biosynthesis/export family protein [Qipengyuania vesicularis]MBX7526670.1 polysaccharide export protein [Qipengyuania vesicularis]
MLSAATLLLAGCFSPSDGLPKGEDAYRIVPAVDANTTAAEYRIGVLDVISIRVFQEPELTFEELSVNSAGTINFPFIGEMTAIGKTPIEFSREIEEGLGTRYIRNPQVVVGVVSSAGQRVTVDGEVEQPGVYEIAGTSSLVESIARARGLKFTAVDDEVIVFRMIDGQRYGAVFDLRAIREGRAPDPQILGGDRIVVGYSTLRGAWEDFKEAAPIFNVFRRF